MAEIHAGRLGNYRWLLRDVGDRRQKWLLKSAYFVLQQFDLIITIIAPSLGLVELNPVIKGLLPATLPLLGFKLALPLLIAWLVPGRLLIPAILLLAGVISWNLKELLLLAF